MNPKYGEFAAALDADIKANGKPAPLLDGVILTCASTITPVAIKWLWDGWLAQGKLQLLAGSPGVGKTTIATKMAATVSSGGSWPDGQLCEAGNVLIWSGEDDAADTLVPRLMAMGADRSKVHFVQSTRINGEVVPFDPARDMVGLHAAIQAIDGDVRLLVVDPIVSAITGDSHKNTEVRRGMQPLVDLASSMQAAVVGITHLSKGTDGRDPTERVTGSIGFTAVVRAVLIAAEVKGDDGNDKRILVRSKNNLAPNGDGFEYHIEHTEVAPGIPSSMVTWGPAIKGKAKDLLAGSEAAAGDSGEDANDACDLLKEELTADTWTPASAACKSLKEAGFTKKQIWSASKKAQVVRKKGAMDAGWYWRLSGAFSPPLLPKNPEDSTEDSEGSSLGDREPSESSRFLESSEEPF